MGTPMNERIRGWAGGHHSKRGSAVMSSVRKGVGSVSMAPSRPWVRGSGPMAATSSSLMPAARKRLKPVPSSSGTPRAA